jgi:hypothetical protein
MLKNGFSRRITSRNLSKALFSLLWITILVRGGVGLSVASAEALVDSSGVATIEVKAGGDRAAPFSSESYLLPGVTFQLLAATRDPATGAWGKGEAISASWATAVTDATGVASFTIPVVGETTTADLPPELTSLGVTGRNGTFASASTANGSDIGYGEWGAMAGSRFVVQLSSNDGAVPVGWRANQVLRTGPTNYDSSTSSASDYWFLTAPLTPGVTQTSGTDFMNAAGFNRAGFSTTTAPNTFIRTRSNGIWQLSRNNPPSEQLCGLNLAVVVDLSSSISAANAADLRYGLVRLVEDLAHTPTLLSAYTFGWSAPAGGGPGVPTGNAWTAGNGKPASLSAAQAAQIAFGRAPTSADSGRDWLNVNMADLDQVTQLLAGIQLWRTGAEFTGTGFNSEATNWSHGLSQVIGKGYDQVLFLTDGNPTWIDARPAATATVYNGFREVEEGIFSANRLKLDGTRIMAIGVGDAAREPNWQNLIAVSGVNVYPASKADMARPELRGVDSLIDADLVMIGSFAHIGKVFKDYAQAVCGVDGEAHARAVFERDFEWSITKGIRVLAKGESEPAEFGDRARAAVPSPGVANFEFQVAVKSLPLPVNEVSIAEGRVTLRNQHSVPLTVGPVDVRVMLGNTEVYYQAALFDMVTIPANTTVSEPFAGFTFTYEAGITWGELRLELITGDDEGTYPIAWGHVGFTFGTQQTANVTAKLTDEFAGLSLENVASVGWDSLLESHNYLSEWQAATFSRAFGETVWLNAATGTALGGPDVDQNLLDAEYDVGISVLREDFPNDGSRVWSFTYPITTLAIASADTPTVDGETEALTFINIARIAPDGDGSPDADDAVGEVVVIELEEVPILPPDDDPPSEDPQGEDPPGDDPPNDPPLTDPPVGDPPATDPDDTKTPVPPQQNVPRPPATSRSNPVAANPVATALPVTSRVPNRTLTRTGTTVAILTFAAGLVLFGGTLLRRKADH